MLHRTVAIGVLSGSIAWVALAGCSSSSTGPAASASDAGYSDRPVDAQAVHVGSVDVTAEFAGTQRGHLNLGAFVTFPPSGPPLAFTVVKDATFPSRVTLRGLEPGAYFIVGFLDLPPYGSGNPMPGPEDPQAMVPVQVRADHDEPVTVRIGAADGGDIPMGDGGADAADDAH